MVKFDVMWISEKSPIGYFLEVDLKYPDELHELHSDYADSGTGILLWILWNF